MRACHNARADRSGNAAAARRGRRVGDCSSRRKATRTKPITLPRSKTNGCEWRRFRTTASPRSSRSKLERRWRTGHDVIFQATLLSGVLYGRADFLRRVERPSQLGDLQLRSARHEARAQREGEVRRAACVLLRPSRRLRRASRRRLMHSSSATAPSRAFRVADYSRYFRQARDRFLAFVARHPNATYPSALRHCAFCAWRDACDARWKADDHLNQVAGITRKQIERLQAAGTDTLEALAALPTAAPVTSCRPIPCRQAALAGGAAARRAGNRQAECRAARTRPGAQARASTGCRHPMRATCSSTWRAIRSRNRASNTCSACASSRWRAALQGDLGARPRGGGVAFEALMDFLVERMRRFPGMHVYHYAHYEPTALKRLMSLHGTREAQVDDLLRGEKFVDLYKVVREAIRTSRAGPVDQGPRDLLHAAARGRGDDRGRQHRPLRALARRRATMRSSKRSERTTRTTAVRRICCATGCSTLRPAELPWFVATRAGTMRPGSPASQRTRADRGSDSRAIAKRCSAACPAIARRGIRTTTCASSSSTCWTSIAARRSRRGGRCSRGRT